MMKMASYFTLNALFVLKIFTFLLVIDFLVMFKNSLIRKMKKTWETNNCSTHIAQYLKK